MTRSGYLLFIALTMLGIDPVAHADYLGKPMSDDEIRGFIIQGTLNDFAKGECFQKILIPVDPATPRVELGDNTRKSTQGISLGYYRWPIEIKLEGEQGAKRKILTPKPAPIYRCQCPCPYTRNSQGGICGESSAYFSYPEDQKPKCYPEDVQPWEVTDFRNFHAIPMKQ